VGADRIKGCDNVQADNDYILEIDSGAGQVGRSGEDKENDREGLEKVRNAE